MHAASAILVRVIRRLILRIRLLQLGTNIGGGRSPPAIPPLVPAVALASLLNPQAPIAQAACFEQPATAGTRSTPTAAIRLSPRLQGLGDGRVPGGLQIDRVLARTARHDH
ncbi:hypothetical protein LIP_0363 [Limnochorda pilosa]|uniref:Uncharacterized protein n=1 Tax=Limnochorda pilosa TaxID=1555112 RepID=A0A0K2SGK4_LIMPI|nr:hypothetical protein LIP_0363 [Limnochorda pilosa]